MRVALTAAEVVQFTERLDRLELQIAVAYDIPELVAHRNSVRDMIEGSYRTRRLNGAHIKLRHRARGVRKDAEFAIGGVLNYLLDAGLRHSGGPRNPKLPTLSDYGLGRSLPDRWMMAARRAAAFENRISFNEALARSSDEPTIAALVREQTAAIVTARYRHERRQVVMAIARRLMARRKGGMLILANRIAMTKRSRDWCRATMPIEEFWQAVATQEQHEMPFSCDDEPVTRVTNFERTSKGTWHRQVYAVEEPARKSKSS